MQQYKKVKERVFELLNKADEGDAVGKVVDWIIMALIALSIVSIILESFSSIYIKYRGVFQVFEAITVIVFTIEYLLRIWTADLLYPDSRHPRLKYFCSFMALIDFLAILPFYLPFFAADLRFIRMMRLLRLFRLLRVFKLERYFEALQTILKVIRNSGPQLAMTVVVCCFILLFSAIIMYTVENPVQPKQFPNVIASLWWAICTLTTVGYGDVYPITDVGKLFASIISLVGIGIIAIPTGIITAGFNQMIIQKKEGGADILNTAARMEQMTEEELLVFHARATKLLKDRGYDTAAYRNGTDALNSGNESDTGR